MMKPRFCYRISAAGLARDGKGNIGSRYTQVNYEGGRLVNKELYDAIHEELIEDLSEDMEIPKEQFECISQEEFDLGHGIR